MDVKYARAQLVTEIFNKTEQILDQITTKVSNETLAELRKQNDNLASNIIQQIEKKAAIKDVCALLDLKSNIDDVNTALQSMHKEVNQKVSNDIYQKIVEGQ